MSREKERLDLANELFPFDAFKASSPKAALQYLELLREFRISTKFKVDSSGVLTADGPILTSLALTNPSITGLTLNSINALVGVGGIPYPIVNPGINWFAQKTSWTGINNFLTASGGWEIDFSAALPPGTKAIVVGIENVSGGWIYWRASGDSNISDTPYPTEASHGIYAPAAAAGLTIPVIVYLSTDYKLQVTVTNAGQDVSFAYPTIAIV